MISESNKVNNVWDFDKPLDKRNLLVGWVITYWCNFNCSYCFQSNHGPNQKLYPVVFKNPKSYVNLLRKNVYGHSFKNHSVNEWLNAFEKIGEYRKIALCITGGEPFLDRKNFYPLLKGLTEMEFIDNIRIDTNGSLNLRLYEKIDFSKVYLNVSFHPEQITFERFIKQINSFQDLGVNISMVNYVMAPSQRDKYEYVRDKLAYIGVKTDPAVYWDGNFPKPEDEVKVYERYLNPFDIRNKCGLESPKGKFCRCPMVGLQLNPDATVHNICFPKRRTNFIEGKREEIEALLFEKLVKCPMQHCFCLHMYSFLLESKRNLNTLNTLENMLKKVFLNSMKKIIISGWYGNKNAGDEAILAAMIASLKGKIEDIEITVFSSDPTYTSKTHHVKAVHQLPFGILPLGSAILRGRSFQTLKALREADLFILGGGGFLSDWQSWTVILQWLGQAVLAKMFKRKVMVYAVGAGPITTKKGKLLTRIILNRLVNVITVRDEASRKWLIKAGVTSQISITADPAVNLEPAKSARISEILSDIIRLKEPVIGVCLAPFFHSERFWPGQHNRFLKYKEACVQVIDYAISKLGAQVIFIPMQPSLDVPFGREIIGSLQHKERAKLIQGEYTPQEIMGILGRMDMVIGMRFHSLIFAAVMNIPMVGIMYLHKSECFLEEIGQRGNAVGIGDGTLRKADDIDVNKMIAILQHVWASRETVKKEITPRIAQLQKKEALNVELALALLKE